MHAPHKHSILALARCRDDSVRAPSSSHLRPYLERALQAKRGCKPGSETLKETDSRAVFEVLCSFHPRMHPRVELWTPAKQ